jgi:hypothetical protein
MFFWMRLVNGVSGGGSGRASGSSDGAIGGNKRNFGKMSVMAIYRQSTFFAETLEYPKGLQHHCFDLLCFIVHMQPVKRIE